MMALEEVQAERTLELARADLEELTRCLRRGPRGYLPGMRRKIAVLAKELAELDAVCQGR